MLKKFFVAVIVALLVASVQIAAAEDFDWSKAPRFGNKAELARYIENERRKGYDTFNVYITNNSILPIHRNEEGKMFIDKQDFVNIVPCRDYFPLHTYLDGRGMQLAFRTVEYPGTHVANAYLSGDTSKLNPDELELYRKALPIVNEAKKRPTEMEKARYIHDEICRRVLEFKDENDRNKTAIGALIDHQAQCQGFTDAFYMLGRMCGLNVGRIFGTDNGGGHAWNWITFSDGKSYCIDVTNGFNTKGTYIFCANKERMKAETYWCLWEIIPNLQ